jgi:RIO-like serine/threonine protein kinase
MNERILKLFMQACRHADYEHQNVPRELVEKFSELIVRECADRVSKMVMRDKFDFIPQDPHSQGWNDAVEYASKELKKTLGVE